LALVISRISADWNLPNFQFEATFKINMGRYSQKIKNLIRFVPLGVRIGAAHPEVAKIIARNSAREFIKGTSYENEINCSCRDGAHEYGTFRG
jgi:hypothetical protein